MPGGSSGPTRFDSIARSLVNNMIHKITPRGRRFDGLLVCKVHTYSNFGACRLIPLDHRYSHITVNLRMTYFFRLMDDNGTFRMLYFETLPEYFTRKGLNSQESVARGGISTREAY
jgi:hypothetical protein